MSEPLVSIIVPVHGVEDYIGRAIESIQKQTYKNWDLYLVDDGSKDRSGEICDEYAKNDAIESFKDFGRFLKLSDGNVVEALQRMKAYNQGLKNIDAEASGMEDQSTPAILFI